MDGKDSAIQAVTECSDDEVNRIGILFPFSVIV